MRRMSWEWVAPVAAASGTAIVGVTGILVTARSGQRQQTTALEVAQQQADAQVAVAREERLQRRLEAAYLELLTAITEFRYWAFTVYPMITSKADDYTMPPLPALPDANSKRSAMDSLLVAPRRTAYEGMGICRA